MSDMDNILSVLHNNFGPLTSEEKILTNDEIKMYLNESFDNNEPTPKYLFDVKKEEPEEEIPQISFNYKSVAPSSSTLCTDPNDPYAQAKSAYLPTSLPFSGDNNYGFHNENHSIKNESFDYLDGEGKQKTNFKAKQRCNEFADVDDDEHKFGEIPSTDPNVLNFNNMSLNSPHLQNGSAANASSSFFSNLYEESALSPISSSSRDTPFVKRKGVKKCAPKPKMKRKRLTKKEKERMTEWQLSERKREANKKNSAKHVEKKFHEMVELRKNSNLLDFKISQTTEKIEQITTDNETAMTMISECTFVEEYFNNASPVDEWVHKYFEQKNRIERNFHEMENSDKELIQLEMNVEDCQEDFKIADEDVVQKKKNVNTYGSRKCRAKKELEKAVQLRELRIKTMEHEKLLKIQNLLEDLTDKLADHLHYICQLFYSELKQIPSFDPEFIQSFIRNKFKTFVFFG